MSGEALPAIPTLLVWSKPIRVQTFRGPRYLRKATPTKEFELIWNCHHHVLKSVGVTYGNNPKSGKMEVCWWTAVTDEELESEKNQLAASSATDANIDIPSPSGLSYLPYQRAGIAFGMQCFRKKKGFLLADEMGLGKSIQTIGIINADQSIHRVLIVAPKGLVINWHRELTKWLCRKQTVGIARPDCFPSTDIVIINYHIVDRFQRKLSFFWDLVVCDEIHLLKNPKTVRAQVILGYRPSKKEQNAGMQAQSGIPTKRKMGLTGTPICNRPLELFPILNWLDPETWHNTFTYRKRYCGMREFKVRREIPDPDQPGKTKTVKRTVYDSSGTSNAEELQQRLRSTIMARRLKKDVLKELPPIRTQIIELPSDGLENLLRQDAALEEKIQKMRERADQAKVTNTDQEYATAVRGLHEGRTAAFDEVARIAHEIALAKVPLIIEHVGEIIEEQHKVILFAHHQDCIAAYNKAFPGSVVIRGDMQPEARMKSVDRFQEDPECFLVIVSIKAGNFGLNLTAAEYVIFSEEDWVPGVMDQCIARAHRYGLEKVLTVQHLVLEGSQDVRRLKTLLTKSQTIKQILDKPTNGQEIQKPVTPPRPESKPILEVPAFKTPARQMSFGF